MEEENTECALVAHVKTHYKNTEEKLFYTDLAIITEEKNPPGPPEKKPEFTERLILSFEQIYGKKRHISPSQLFGNTKQTQILIAGRAGIGKTTLCKHLIRQWAEGNLWQGKFALIVHVQIRKILTYPADKCTIPDLIHSECLPRLGRSKRLPLSAEEVATQFDNINGEVLFIVDGLDEALPLVVESEKSDVSYELRQRKQLVRDLLNEKYLILTSRPYGIEQLKGKQLSNCLQLENVGFNNESITNFIEQAFPHASADSAPNPLATTLSRFIDRNPNIAGIASVPIMLKFICEIWETNSARLENNDATLSMTDLYSTVLNNTCLRYLAAHTYASRNLVDDPRCKPLIIFLEELAFEQSLEAGLIVPAAKLQRRLEPFNNKYGQDFFGNVLKLGLLRSTGSDEKNTPYPDREDYEFIHLTVQEFFTARYIARKLQERDIEIYFFIRDHKYDPRYEIIWWFVAGLLKEDAETLEIFFSILESPPRDYFGLYHMTLIMQCMGECELKAVISRKDKFLKNLGEVLDFFVTRTLVPHGINSLRTFENCLVRNPLFLHQPEVCNKICELLTHYRILALLGKFSRLPNVIISQLKNLFIYSKFGSGTVNIHLIEKSLLMEPALFKNIPLLPLDDKRMIRVRIIEIFTNQSASTSDEIAYIIATSLTPEDAAPPSHNDRFADVERGYAFAFFEKISTPLNSSIIETLSLLLSTAPPPGRIHAISFFRQKPAYRSEKIVDIIKGLCNHQDPSVSYAASYFFSEENLPQKVQKNSEFHQETYTDETPTDPDKLFEILEWDGRSNYAHLPHETQINNLIYEVMKTWAENLKRISGIRRADGHPDLRKIYIRKRFLKPLRTWETYDALDFLIDRPTLPAEVFRWLSVALKEKSFSDNIYAATLVNSRLLFEFVEYMSKRNTKVVEPESVYLLVYRLRDTIMPVFQSKLSIHIGSSLKIDFEEQEALTDFVKNFQSVAPEFTGLHCDETVEDFFEKLDADLRVPTSADLAVALPKQTRWKQQLRDAVAFDTFQNPPAFFLEQQQICQHRYLQYDLEMCGTTFSSQKPPCIFLSHAWQLKPEEDAQYKLNEQWTDCCTLRLSEHLELLGYQVLLDFKDSRLGDSLNETMHHFVNSADYVAILCTNTYFHKFKYKVNSGVAIEFNLTKYKIEDKRAAGDLKTNVMLPLLTVDRTPAEFPIFDGIGGVISYNLCTNGYVPTLLQIVRATRGEAAEQSVAEIFQKHGLFKTHSAAPTASPHPIAPQGLNSNNAPHQ